MSWRKSTLVGGNRRWTRQGNTLRKCKKLGRARAGVSNSLSPGPPQLPVAFRGLNVILGL